MNGLTFIGLGPYDEKDMSLKAQAAARACERVFAEFYTAIPAGTTKEKLEDTLGREISLLGREEVEDGTRILQEARRRRTCLLVVGDPFSATTHVELRIRAKKEGIPVRVVHGASALTAVPGLLGLQHYKFGRTTTLPFPDRGFFPESPYDVIRENAARGLHTLVLLDIQAERSRIMSAREGLGILAALEGRKRGGVLAPDALVCAVARAGSDEPVARAGRLRELLNEDLGPPHHTLVVPGKLHFMEAEALAELAGAPRELLKTSD